MSTLKRVLIIAPNPHGVHDGDGGVHFKGDKPVLPSDVADLFIDRKLAVLAEEDVSPEKLKAILQDKQDQVRQRDQKARAEVIMRAHDNKEPEQRVAEAFPDAVPEGKPNGRAKKPTLKLKANPNEAPPRLRS